MTTELNPGWRWENFEHLRSTVVSAPNGVEYELRPGDITHPRAQRLLDAMFAALTQRPAAQTEREAFEAWAKLNNVQLTLDVNQHDYHYPQARAGWSAWQARASLPAPQQATPEPLIVKGAMAGMVDAQVRDLWPTKGATPEPVGEPVARVELMAAGGNAGLATRIAEIYNPLRERLRPGDLLFTRPAPGVPEGWTDADADAARLAMELECLLLDTKDTAAVSRWWASANDALDLHRARLTAAQAKGGA